MKVSDFNVEKHQSITALANELERWRANRKRKELDTTPLDKAILVCDELLRLKGYARREHQVVTLATAAYRDSLDRADLHGTMSAPRYYSTNYEGDGGAVDLIAGDLALQDYHDGLIDDVDAYEMGLIDERGAELQ